MKGATPATAQRITKHQKRRTRRIKARAALRNVVDRIFPGVDATLMPDHWEPPVDNTTRLQDYQTRRKQYFGEYRRTAA